MIAMTHDALGIVPANLLLPADGVSPAAWACVACDQYTSQPDYWEDVALQVGAQPSTLRLMLPSATWSSPPDVCPPSIRPCGTTCKAAS